MGGLGTAGVRARTGKCLGFEDIQSPTFGPEGDKDAEEGKIRWDQEGVSHLLRPLGTRTGDPLPPSTYHD